MQATNFLIVTVVTGLLVIGTGAVVARLRRRTAARPTLRPSAVGSGRAAAAVAAALAVVVGAVAVTVLDPVTMVFAALAVPVVGYFAWGIYYLARSRGLPRAHAIGLSVWLFGVVLIGVVAVNLLLG